MDAETIAAYQRSAAAHCARYRLIVPNELRRFMPAGFHAGEPTADIGCGSGRDTAWLSARGFPTAGYDASPAMLAEARAAFPALTFAEERLPALASIADEAYANVLCVSTLMHLPADELPLAVASLARILRPRGRLLLSVRTGVSGALREADGRLFTPITAEQLAGWLADAGFTIVRQQPEADPYRAEISWQTVLAERLSQRR